MITINQARCTADLVPGWALQVLARAVVLETDARAGITHPTTTEGEGMMASIDANVTPIQTPTGELFVSQEEEERRRCIAARDTARQIYALIPLGPQWVSFADTVNSLATTSESAARWADERNLRTQLADAADLTIEQIRTEAKSQVPLVLAGLALLLLWRFR